MRKLVLASALILSSSVMALESDYNEIENSEKKVSFEKSDGTGFASLEIKDPIVNNYQGWNLKAVVDLRGFSFRYIDNSPCSGLVTYFDGRSYLFFQACGDVKADDLTKLYQRANEKLKIGEILKKQSRPNLY
jgi:hypothetical protein